MNKLLVDGEKYFLEDNISHINVSGKAVLYINNLKNDINLEINMLDNSKLIINDFNLSNKNTSINVIQNNYSFFEYNHTFKINDTYNFNYIAHINGDNNVNNINIKGISKGQANINVDSIVFKKTKDNVINENIKVLTIDGKAYISPMLHVNTLNVIANHNTAISNVNKDELFYLMSKGITHEDAIKLIENGYLYGMFKNEEEFLNIIK